MNREGSKYGKMIMEINQAGKINPSWLTVGLIETAIKVRASLVILQSGLEPYRKGTFDFSQNLIKTPSGDYKQVPEEF